MATTGKSARNKGNNYERKIVNLFKELGYPEARRSSDYIDNLKVDIEGTGIFNIQAKAVERLGSVHAILESMPKDGHINVVFHKRNRQGTVVSMSEEDFITVVKMFKNT